MRNETYKDGELVRLEIYNPGLAAVLSFFIPGLGHLYRGRVIVGFLWFFFVGAGYCALIFPGLFLHLVCIYKSYSV